MTIYYEETTFLTKKSTLHGSEDVTEAYDPDGDCVARLYGEWTPHQLKQAIELANRYYEMGLKNGASMKAAEIRDALGIER